MVMVMAVSFTRYGQLYYLDPDGVEAQVGDKVLIPTDEGPEVVEVVWAPTWVSEDLPGLPRCAGRPDAAALERDERNRRRKADAKINSKRLVREHGLPMKIVGIDVVDTRPDIDLLTIVFFTAPHRVDFRALVRELAAALRSRVELRQIGPRDEARAQQSLGPCGRDTCCSTFLTRFEAVSVRMAKDQDLPPNPMRISGACGRLMCCLVYEQSTYTEWRSDAPAIGSRVTTVDGVVTGTVVGHQVPADTVVVRDDATGRRTPCSKASVCGSRQLFDSGRGQQ